MSDTEATGTVRIFNSQPRLIVHGKVQCPPGESEHEMATVAKMLESPGHRAAFEKDCASERLKCFSPEVSATRAKEIPLGPVRPESLNGYTIEQALEFVAVEDSVKALKKWLKVEQMQQAPDRAQLLERLRARVKELS
jgi:hypothetical protein